MEKGDYSISDIYQGSSSSFNSNYGNFTGYHIPAGDIGMSTDARTANVVKEISKSLSAGGKAVEMSQVSAAVFDAIPKQELRELNRLSKLTGVDVTIHAPVVEASGVTQQGFDEANREAVERQITQALMRSHDVNPKGGSPVTFHSSAQLPGTEYRKDKNGKTVMKKLIAIDRETGKMAPLNEEDKFYPSMGKTLEKGKKYTPEEELKMLNATQWDNSLSQAIFHKNDADKILDRTYPVLQGIMNHKGPLTQESIGDLTPTEREVMERVSVAQEYLKLAEMTGRSLFHKAYKFGTEEDKKRLMEVSKNYQKMAGYDEKGEVTEEGIAKLQNPKNRSESLNYLFKNLNVGSPEMFVPIEEFAVDKSSTSFGNAIFKAYKKFGNTTPILSLENPPAGAAVATGEDLKKLVEATRNKFVENAVKDGMSKSTAQNEAKKLIGATWDVGHINMLRKQGYTEKDLVKETETIAPFVKHVHLSDNFGFEHTELPMGMGNVPIKKMMEKIDQKGFEGKKIVEAMSWWQHFSPAGGPSTPPLNATLEAMGSPIYSMTMGPYWSQVGGYQQGYYGGYGGMLPQKNFQTFGAGFSQLPSELGGNIPTSGQNRLSGAPME
jgi:hypothetical protein